MAAAPRTFHSSSNHDEGSRPSISLVLPAYNEESVIAQAIDEAVVALTKITDDFEVLVVDDGSTDATAALVENVACQSSHVRLLKQDKNRGYGAALRRGFSAATKELVGFTDADCQFHLGELDRLVLLTRDYDIVCGYRIDRQDPWLRRMYSAGYNVLVRALLGTRVRDCDCALKLFHRDVLAKLPITTDGFLVNGEMLASAHQQEFSIVEVGVSHRPRAGGESKVSIAHIPVVLAALVRFWWSKVLFPGTADTQLSASEQWSSRQRTVMTLLLLAIGSLLLFINLNYALIEPDEARYAQIALEMQQSGDWLVPRHHGEPYLDKPPLLYWLTATSYSLFGVNERSARLPGALAVLLTVLTTYLLGRRLVGDRAAWCGGAVLLMCGGFIAAGRYIMMDGLLTFFTTLAFLASFRALFATRFQLGWWTLAGAACGCGILTKGPVAPVLCLPVVAGIAWLSKNRQAFQGRNLLACFMPMMLIAAPWFLLIAAEQSEFVGYFFWKQNFMRYVNAFDHAQPWWFYPPMLALGMMPATLLLPGLAVYLVQRQEKQCHLRTPELGALLLAAAWIIAFFSVSSCKLVTYILPAYPLLALASGKMLSDISCSTNRVKNLLQTFTNRAAWLTVSTVAWIAIGGVIVQVVLDPRTKLLAAMFLLVPVVVLTLLYGKWLNSRQQLFAAAALSYVVMAAYGFGFVVPEFAQWRSVSHSAARLQADLGAATPVVYFGRRSQAASFAISGEVEEFASEEIDEFEQFMAAHAEAVVVVYREDFNTLNKACGDTITFVGPQARSCVYLAKEKGTGPY